MEFTKEWSTRLERGGYDRSEGISYPKKAAPNDTSQKGLVNAFRGLWLGGDVPTVAVVVAAAVVAK